MLRLFPTVSRITSLKNAARLVKNPIPVVNGVMQKLGPTYMFHIGGRNKGLITQDLDLIEHILQKNHKNFNKSPLQTKELAAYVGNGLLTNNGNNWLRQRRLIQPAFNRKNINSLISLMEEEVNLVCQNEMAIGKRVNLSHLSAMLTFHIVARTIFSDEVRHDEIIRMRNNVERVQKMIILQIRQPYKIWFYSMSGMLKKHHKLAKEAKDLIYRLIQTRKASVHRKDDILQFMLDTRYEDTGLPMSDQQLVDELLILMVAGHETTAQSIIWTMLLLHDHAETLYNVRQEINEIGNDYEAYFKQGSILMASIKESMRLYPPAWVIDRVGIEDDEVNGHLIPKDTIIMNYIYGLHRNPDHWEKPNKFLPERFIEARKPSAYFPFGAGPRLCIGNHFAYLELVVTIVNLLQNYTIRSSSSALPGMNPLITLQPDRQVFFMVEARV